MKLIRCEAGGHFYDSELFNACPHCEKEQDVTPDEFPATEPVTTPVEIPIEVPVEAPVVRSTVFCASCGKSMPITKQFCTNCGKKLRKPVAEPVVNAVFPITQPIIAQPYSDETIAATVAATVAEAVAEVGGTADAIPQTVAAITPHYVPEYVNPSAVSGDEAPVAGWLVCVNGAYQGRSFEIKAGQNYVGRAKDMDIVLERETSVSFLRHAVVIYEPVKDVFYIQQGESRGLTYHYDELVLTHVELLAYDRIRLGSAEFIFVPLCGEGFSWEEHIKK